MFSKSLTALPKWEFQPRSENALGLDSDFHELFCSVYEYYQTVN